MHITPFIGTTATAEPGKYVAAGKVNAAAGWMKNMRTSGRADLAGLAEGRCC